MLKASGSQLNEIQGGSAGCWHALMIVALLKVVVKSDARLAMRLSFELCEKILYCRFRVYSYPKELVFRSCE